MRVKAELRHGWRWLARLARGLLIIVLVLIAAYLVATVATGRRLAAELSRIRAAGQPLTMTGFAQKLPPAGMPNAADGYRQALQALRLSRQEREAIDRATAPGKTLTAADKALLRQVMAANGPYFVRLEEASRIETCVFPTDWRFPPAASFAGPARLREAARFLAARAEIEAEAGEYDAAAKDLSTILRLADHAGREPTIVHALLRIAIQKQAVQSLQGVLSAGLPSPAARARLEADLTRAARISNLRPGLLGERVTMLTAMDYVRQPSTYRSLLRSPHALTWAAGSYPFIGRPLYNLDELACLRFMARAIAAGDRPYPESRRRLQAALAEIKRTPAYRSAYARTTTDIYERLFRSHEDHLVDLEMARLALELKAYQQAHGAYPPTLAALGKTPPTDPYSGKPYRYQTKGRGFVLWSVGWDGHDDGGKAVAARKGDPSPDRAFRVTD